MLIVLFLSLLEKYLLISTIKNTNFGDTDTMESSIVSVFTETF